MLLHRRLITRALLAHGSTKENEAKILSWPWCSEQAVQWPKLVKWVYHPVAPWNTNNLSRLVKTCTKPPLIFLSHVITNQHWLNVAGASCRVSESCSSCVPECPFIIWGYVRGRWTPLILIIEHPFDWDSSWTASLTLCALCAIGVEIFEDKCQMKKQEFTKWRFNLFDCF